MVSSVMSSMSSGVKLRGGSADARRVVCAKKDSSNNKERLSVYTNLEIVYVDVSSLLN